MNKTKIAEDKLSIFGYKRKSHNKWTNGRRVVQVEHSSEYARDSIRIWWKEAWKDYYAIVFDYSRKRGPVCVVPVAGLFSSDLVKEKRKQDSYANSGYWWSQNFPIGHELAKHVLSFKDRWDVLQNAHKHTQGE